MIWKETGERLNIIQTFMKLSKNKDEFEKKMFTDSPNGPSVSLRYLVSEALHTWVIVRLTHIIIFVLLFSTNKVSLVFF